jgi:hypothetical protein
VGFLLSLSVLLAAPGAQAVSGVADAEDEFPFVVQVLAENSVCSGVLVFPRLVVTAGHCVVHPPKVKATASVQARVVEEAEILVTTRQGSDTIRAESIGVSDAYLNGWRTEWAMTGLEVLGDYVWPADVAVLVLGQDAGVEPVRSLEALFDWRGFYAAMDGEFDYAEPFDRAYSSALASNFPGRYAEVTVVGYGASDTRQFRPALIFDPDRCAVDDPRAIPTLRPFCVSSKASALVEQGDSGGALLARGADGGWILLGILSAGVMGGDNAPMTAGEYVSMYAATYVVLEAAERLGYFGPAADGAVAGAAHKNARAK